MSCATATCCCSASTCEAPAHGREPSPAPLRRHPAGRRVGPRDAARFPDGREIIDGAGGAAVACIGHGNARVAAAIGAQAARLAYAHTATFTSDPAEELADILLGDEPGGLTRAWFCSSGSEGMEAALKLARQYFVEIGQPQRTRFIARRQSYHGNTLGALGGRRQHDAPRALRADPGRPRSAMSRPASPIASRKRARATRSISTGWPPNWRRSSSASAPENVIAFVAEPVVGATTGCVDRAARLFPARCARSAIATARC